VDDLIPMLISTVLGTVVGWERQMGRKPAGLRTHVLVCLGSTLFVLLGRHALAEAVPDTVHVNIDPTRIIHGVITGVGFLGAGSIMRTEGYVHGLTTAASVWMVAAIGVSVGVHAYSLAVIGTVLALIVLEGFRWVERFLSPESDSNG
jgi:putative Mg2+ transporter-C (MgtC) family protein